MISTRSELADVPYVGTLIPVTDYIPPHKMTEFVPYDGVVTLHDDGTADWTADRVRDHFDAHDITYDAICGVGPNDSRADGDALAFVRFRSPPTTQ